MHAQLGYTLQGVIPSETLYICASVCVYVCVFVCLGMCVLGGMCVCVGGHACLCKLAVYWRVFTFSTSFSKNVFVLDGRRYWYETGRYRCVFLALVCICGWVRIHTHTHIHTDTRRHSKPPHEPTHWHTNIHNDSHAHTQTHTLVVFLSLHLPFKHQLRFHLYPDDVLSASKNSSSGSHRVRPVWIQVSLTGERIALEIAHRRHFVENLNMLFIWGICLFPCLFVCFRSGLIGAGTADQISWLHHLDC